MLRHEVKIDGEALADIFAEAVREFLADDTITLTVSEGDTFFTRSVNATRLEEMTGPNRHIKVKKSVDIPPGSIILESSQRVVDASVETQLENIREDMKSVK